MIQIDRCVCFKRSFSELQVAAQEAGLTDVDGLREHIQFGMHCGLCLPYVRRMLKTGESVFHELIMEDEEPE